MICLISERNIDEWNMYSPTSNVVNMHMFCHNGWRVHLAIENVLLSILSPNYSVKYLKPYCHTELEFEKAHKNKCLSGTHGGQLVWVYK